MASHTTEVISKSDARINRETALAWAERAEGCFAQCKKTGNAKWMVRAETYRQESLEHASQVGDGGKLVGILDRRLTASAKKYGCKVSAFSRTKGRYK